MDPNGDLLIRWDKDGSENVVAFELLICHGPFQKGVPCIGSRATMKYRKERWHGTVLDVAALLSSDDSDDDVPLSILRGTIPRVGGNSLFTFNQTPSAASSQAPGAASSQPPSAASGQPPSAASGQPPNAASGQPPNAASSQAPSAASSQANSLLSNPPKVAEEDTETSVLQETSSSAASSQTPCAASSQPPSAASGQAPTAASSQAPIAASSQAPSAASGQPPSAASSQAPGAASSQTPVAASSQTPGAASSQAPSAASSQAPSAASSQAPSAASGQPPSAASGQPPSAASSQAPTAASSQAPIAASSQAPSAASGQPLSAASGQAPSAASSQPPNAASSQPPGAAPSQTPVAASSQTPGAASSQAPTAASSQAPIAASSQEPSAASGQPLSAASGQAPSAASSQPPSAASSQAPGAASSQTPVAASSQTPNAASGQAPSQAPSAASGQPPSSASSLVSSSSLPNPPEVADAVASEEELLMTCDNFMCRDEIFSICVRCNVLLCYDHFVNDDPCSNHNAFAQIFTQSIPLPPDSLNTQSATSLPDLDSLGTQSATSLPVLESSSSGPVTAVHTCNAQPPAREEHPQFHTSDQRTDLPLENPKPCENNKAKKRKANPEEWKQNQQKKNRNAGKTYFSRDGTERAARKMKSPCEGSCRFKCSVLISQGQREKLFSDYWQLGSYERQRDFICTNVIECEGKERQSRTYRLPVRSETAGNAEVQDRYVQVCKLFFLNTLDIGSKLIRYTLESKKNGVFCTQDQRGRHTPHNKTTEQDLDIIRNHIQSFQVIPSHYCRSSSQKQYLPGDLSVPRMFEMYQKTCARPQSLKIYRNIFDTEFNLGFHMPKKDECKTCVGFSHMSTEDQKEHQSEYDTHMQNKVRAREEKERDKQKAATDPFFQSYTFDLQQVLSCPSACTSVLYYKRKLSSYNLTVYNQSNKEGHCYMWDEINGRRGSSEIGSCLIYHLQQLPERVRHVTLFSDCCGGQNRNKYMAAGLLYLVRTSPISVIEQKFLESGHTEMEVDSMHSAIEQVKRKVPVYHPDQWATLAGAARRSQPYKVSQLKHDQFFDLKKLAGVILNNTVKDVSGEKVAWIKIKHIVYEKQEPHILKFRYTYDEHFRELRVSASGRTSKKLLLETLHPEPLKMTQVKKHDLLSLCDSNVIPPVYHNYYRSLPAEDVSEDEEDVLRPED